jgi:HEAT repeat protein
VRSEAATALGRRGDPQGIVPLIGILADPEERVRRDAIKALMVIGRPATEPLILALHESDNITQAGAAQALGQIGEERSIEPLIWVFKNGDRPVRHAAVAAIAGINKSLAVSPLIQILGDLNLQSDLRADAAIALGEMDDPRAKEPLIFAMSYDKDNSVRMNAARAMKKVMRTIFK